MFTTKEYGTKMLKVFLYILLAITVLINLKSYHLEFLYISFAFVVFFQNMCIGDESWYIVEYQIMGYELRQNFIDLESEQEFK